jgi:hypothetical protein
MFQPQYNFGQAKSTTFASTPAALPVAQITSVTEYDNQPVPKSFGITQHQMKYNDIQYFITTFPMMLKIEINNPQNAAIIEYIINRYWKQTIISKEQNIVKITLLTQTLPITKEDKAKIYDIYEFLMQHI